MLRRLMQQFAGGTAGRRPARGRTARRGRASGGTGARIGSAVERYLRSRR
jgi:hypothetical protein